MTTLKAAAPVLIGAAALAWIAYAAGRDRGAARGGARGHNRASGPRLPAMSPDIAANIRELVSGAAPNMPRVPAMPAMPAMPDMPAGARW